MMIRPARLAVFLAGLFCASSALAWDPLGHMLVSQIAYDHLTPAAKIRADQAIARFNAKDKPDAPYDFVTAACWMDDIRARAEMKSYAVWHYVTLPFTADGLPIPEISAGPNVINGLQKTLAILAGQATDVAIDQDTALVIIEHLAGDIHQPLHATGRNNDAGGNFVKIDNLKDPLVDLVFSKGGNLHFFWDSAYRRIYKEGFATVSFEAPLYDRLKPVAGHREARSLIRTQAEAIEKKYPPSILTTQGDPVSWATESHAIGFAVAYGKKLPAAKTGRPIKLPQAYVSEAQGISQKRIALAGYRLAAELNRLAAAPAVVEPAATPEPSPSPAAAPLPSTGNPAR